MEECLPLSPEQRDLLREVIEHHLEGLRDVAHEVTVDRSLEMNDMLEGHANVGYETRLLEGIDKQLAELYPERRD